MFTVFILKALKSILIRFVQSRKDSITESFGQVGIWSYQAIENKQGLELQKYIAVPKVRVMSSFGLDILLPALL